MKPFESDEGTFVITGEEQYVGKHWTCEPLRPAHAWGAVR